MKKILLFSGLLISSFSFAQAISFETSEGYTVGDLGGQQSWTMIGTTPSSIVVVSDARGSQGSTNSLRLVSGNTQATQLLGAVSPIFSDVDADVTFSADIYSDAFSSANSDLYIDTQELFEGQRYITTRVVFNYQGNVRIVTGWSPTDTLVYQNFGTYSAQTWVNLKIKFYPTTSTIEYLINDALVYTGTYYNAEIPEFVQIGFDDYASGFNVDNISITETLKNDKFIESNLSVYPNPTADVINISNSLNAVVNSIEIADINGRVVKTQKINATDAQILINDLSAGVYLLKVATDQGTATKKIVKQ
jgi:hypothetical protein